jgi:sulfate/thiosulfate-binding protein
VASGLPADIVALSLAPDVDKLVEPGIVDANWADTPTDGFVTNSVVVLAVRRGNPENIKGWEDIVKPGVEVITPNPFTSGGAKWNLMAAYGSQIAQGKSPAEATDFLHQVLANTAVQDKSAREALQTFSGGKGDVLISYENEAITAQKAGIDLDYVIPDQTILIQNPAAVTTESKNPDKAKAFLDWLVTPEAQKIYAAKGYRSVLPDLVDKSVYPDPKTLFKIDDFGGWPKVNDEFFDPDKGSVAAIEKDLGVSTAG